MWIFAYGSLIWDPGFVPAERRIARLNGYARGFFMWSVVYRGTAERPGLVLALDQATGESCLGFALKLPNDPDKAADILAQIRARELVSYAYREEAVEVEADGAKLAALTYVVNRDSGQYAQGLDPEAQAAIIAERSGARGRNADYLFQTEAALTQAGIADPTLAELAARVRALDTN